MRVVNIFLTSILSKKVNSIYKTIGKNLCIVFTNNLIWRYHGTFREMDKVRRAFQNEETAQQINDNFRTYYNFMRKHQGINGLTPAQASGLNEPREVKKLLVKSLNT